MAIVLFIMGACSPSLDKKYNPDTIDQDATEMRENGDITDEEFFKIGAYVISAQLQGKDLSGMTYGDILEEANKTE